MTICDECGAVLTDAAGNRQQPSVFDSSLSQKHPNDYTKNLIYAHCEQCHEKLMPKQKQKFKGFEKSDGTIIKTAYIDGYHFGERQLEGVNFKATIQDDGTLSVAVCDSGKEYFSGMAKKKWLAAALDFITETDVLNELEEGGDEVVLIKA